MRKQLTGYLLKCDGNGCKSFAEIENDAFLPPGWYSVRIPDAEGRVRRDGENAFDMCSLRCVRRWTEGRSEATGERIGTRGSITPWSDAICHICGAPLPKGSIKYHWAEHNLPGVTYDTFRANVLRPKKEEKTDGESDAGTPAE